MPVLFTGKFVRYQTKDGQSRIRAVRSSEKVFWKKVLDIYATSIDYSPATDAARGYLWAMIFCQSDHRIRLTGTMAQYSKGVTMAQKTTNKYGIKMIPRTAKTPPKNIQSLNDDSVDIIKIAKQVIEEHKDVLAALAKR